MRRAFRTTCVALAALLASAGAEAADPGSVRRLIESELVYPREIVYTLPAVLPSRDAGESKNAEYLSVLAALKRSGVLRSAGDNGRTRVTVADDNFDVVRQRANIRYEAVDFGIILGEWAVEVDSVSDEGPVTVALGRRYAVKTTRLNEKVLESLSAEKRRKYSSVPLRWTIETVNGAKKVVEKERAE